MYYICDNSVQQYYKAAYQKEKSDLDLMWQLVIDDLGGRGGNKFFGVIEE